MDPGAKPGYARDIMRIRTGTIERLRDALLESGRRGGTVLSSAYETLAREGLLNDEEAAALHRVDPVAETMFLMMAADGTLAETERDAVRGAIRGLTGDVLHAGTINFMLETYAARLQAQGREARLREIAQELSREASEAESAFALAAAVALADDQVADEENRLIDELARWFGFSEQEADGILERLSRDPD
jgi:tellurite resistance protein